MAQQFPQPPPGQLLAGLANLQPQAPAGEARLSFTAEIEPWLFCGGAVPRQNDRVTLVRPSAVLGQLRFFWRLLEDHPNLKALRQAEGEVFGDQNHPAPFRLAVDILDPGQSARVPEKIGVPGSYLLFSGRAESKYGQIVTPVAELRAGVQATFTFCGNLHPSLVRAVQAWTLLGGVGSRTRRGLGAIQTPLPGGNVATLDRLLQSLPRTTAPRCNGKVRGIAGLWRTDVPFRDAAECLYALETWYKNYRQDRRPGSPRPGRSYWDEPELVRQLTGEREPIHAALATPQGRHAEGWARGVLGLPIVFHFKDRKDPQQTTLQGAQRGIERMASPLLFRSVKLAPRTYVGVVAQLTGPYEPPGGLGLKLGRNRVRAVPTTPQVTRVWTELFQAGANSPKLKLVQVA